MLERQELFDRVRELGEDKEKGAVELTFEAANLIHNASMSLSDPAFLSKLCIDLLKRKSSMAPMVNLVNDALLLIDDGGDIENFTRDHISTLKGSKDKVADKASDLIENGYRVMTYSNSSTIIETFKSAIAKGKEFEVILSEARPVREGLIMARSIRDLGIPVTLVADSALFQEMEDVNLVMVGADSLSGQYLVNKIGTRGLASQARLLGKEIVVVAGSEKILPSMVDCYKKEFKPPNEIATDREGINVVNYYFDKTPLHLITKIVTEKGTMGPFEIIQEAKQKKVHSSIIDHFKCD